MMHNTKAKSSLFPELIDAVMIKRIGAAAIAAPAINKTLNPRFFRNVICLSSLLSVVFVVFTQRLRKKNISHRFIQRICDFCHDCIGDVLLRASFD